MLMRYKFERLGQFSGSSSTVIVSQKGLSRSLFVAVLHLLILTQASLTKVQADDLKLLQKTTVDEQVITFADGPATRFGNNVNGRTHQQHAVVSHRGYQYAAYVDAKRRICLGRRKLASPHWSVIRFEDHRFDTNDSHNAAAIGICEKDGTIHFAFDHHATQLNYRVSKLGVANQPESYQWEPNLFGPITRSLGSVQAHERVTYPRFFSSSDGNLMLYYRSVTSGNGDGMIEKYDGKAHDWVSGLGKFIARDVGVFKHNGKTSIYRCPYMNPLCFGGQRLHASWVWRDRFESTHPSNQHDLCYAYSDDFGVTWHNSVGTVIGETDTNPIHLDTPGLVAFPISPDELVSNSNSQFAFDEERVHVVLKQLDPQSEMRPYHHYWRGSDGQWSREVLPFSGNRPKLVGTDDGELILIHSAEIEEEAESEAESEAEPQEHLLFAKGTPNASGSKYDWRLMETPKQLVIGEPLVDVHRWKSEKVLSVYCQAAPSEIIQTESAEPVDSVPSALHVIDYRLP